MKYFSITGAVLFALCCMTACEKKQDAAVLTGKDQFVVVTNITNGATPLGYLGTLHDLSVGSYTNAHSRQTTAYPYVYVNNEDVYVVPNGAADVLQKFTRQDDGTLLKTGSLQLPAASESVGLAFENDTSAYLTLFNTGRIAVFNPSSMVLKSYIDLTSYAIGDGSPDPSNIVYNNGKLYVALAQTHDNYTSVSPAQLLIIDLKNNNKITSITDSRTQWAGSLDSHHALFFDENGDLYVYCISSFGYVPGQKSGFLRIKNGQTTFDPAYFFNINDVTINGLGGNVNYLEHMYYTGNGTVYATGNIPSLASNPPDYVKDHTFGAFKVDLKAQTIAKIELPFSNGYANYVLPYNGKILFTLSTTTGSGIYSYDPATGAAATTPVVSTQGDASVLEAFK